MRRSLVAPLNEAIDLIGRALGECFDIPISEVPNPPGDLQARGLLTGTGAERDALHESVNAKMNSTVAHLVARLTTMQSVDEEALGERFETRARRKAGIYFTPSWLVQQVLEAVF